MIKKYIPITIRIHLRPIRAMLYRLIYARLSIGLTRQGAFEQPKEEIEASKYISVIVPIMDSPEFLIRCLRSLEKYASSAEIILVDDGSQKEETIRIIDDFSHKNNWQLVRNNSPVGHSRACEAGARLATRPYICLLNSDAVVTPWSWSAAKHAFESDPRIAVTGPSTSRAFTKQVVQVAEYCRHHWNDCQIFAFAQKYVKAQKYSEFIDLPVISGFAFFVRRTVWEDFGGFNKNLPDYGNETELCIRLLKSGWRLVWTRNSYIHHFGSASYKDKRVLKSLVARNFIYKNGSVDK